MPELGSAVFRIYTDAADFHKDLDKAEARANKAAANIDDSFKDVDRSARRAGDGIQSFSADLDDARQSSRGLNQEVKQTSSTVNNADGVLRKLTNTFRGHRAEVDKTTKAHDGLINKLLKANIVSKFLGNSFKILKWPTLIAGAGLAVQAIAALTAGAVALVGAMGPLTGTIAAMPAGFTALASSMITVKLAMSGVGDSFKDFGKTLKQATPEATKFASQIKQYEPQIRKLQRAAQRGLFPGIAEGIKNAMPFFPVFERSLAAVGKTLGNIAASTGKMIGSGPFGRMFGQLTAQNTRVLSVLGTSLQNLIMALLRVGVVARPLVAFMANGIQKFSEWANASAKAGQESGRMASFFHQTEVAMKRWGSIIGNVITGLYNIGKAAAPAGRQLARSLDIASGHFRAWTESTRGKNQLKEYFDNVVPTLEAMGRLVRSITRAFFRMGNDQNLGPMLDQLRTQFLPVLEQLLTTTAKSFGPHIINLLTQLGTLIGTLAGQSGPLTMFVDTLSLFASTLNQLLQSNPQLAQMAITASGFVGVWKAASFTAGITGLKNLSKGLRDVKKAAAEAKAAQAGAAAVSGAASAETAAAPAVGGIAGKLGQALAVMPPQAKIAAAAIAAIGAAFVIAYTKSETFRNIVQSVWAGIKTGAVAVANAVVAAWNGVKTGFQAVLTAVGAVRSGLSSAFSWLSGAINTVVTEIKSWKTVWFLVGAAITAISLQVKVTWALISTIIKAGMAFITTFLKVEWAIVSNIVKFAWALISQFIKTSWELISKIVKDGMKVVIGVLQPGFVFIKGLVVNGWDAIKTVFRGALDIIMGIVKVFSGLLKGDFGKMWEGIKQIFHGAVTAVLGIIKGATTPLRSAAAAVATAVVNAFEFLKALPGKIASYLKFAVDKIRDWIVNFKNAALDAGKGIVEGIISGVKSLPGKIVEAARWLKDKVVNAVKDFLGIHSPSTVFQEIGGNMVQGLIKGMDFGSVKSFISKNLGSMPSLALKLIKSGVISVGGLLGKGVGALSGLIGKLGGGKDAMDLLGPKIREALMHQTGTVQFDGKTIPKWIAPILEYARQHGWGGSVSSGVRSYAEQVRLYNQLGGEAGVKAGIVARPGTSNHEGSTYPRGAIDVDGAHANQLEQIIARSPFAGLLKHYKNPRDPYHFSAKGNAAGGVIDRPTISAIGEDAPKWPEFVIPTKPTHRSNAMHLLAGAASAIGIPGFAGGGGPKVYTKKPKGWSNKQWKAYLKANAPVKMPSKPSARPGLDTYYSGATTLASFGYDPKNPASGVPLQNALNTQLATWVQQLGKYQDIVSVPYKDPRRQKLTRGKNETAQHFKQRKTATRRKQLTRARDRYTNAQSKVGELTSNITNANSTLTQIGDDAKMAPLNAIRAGDPGSGALGLNVIGQQAAEARFTQTLDDDVAAQTALVEQRKKEYDAAKATGLPDIIAEAANNYKDAIDGLQTLVDTQAEAAKQARLSGISREAAEARLTDTLDDDIKAAKDLVAERSTEYEDAKKTGVDDKIAEAANNYADAIASLDSIQKAAQDSIESLQTLLDRQKQKTLTAEEALRLAEGYIKSMRTSGDINFGYNGPPINIYTLHPGDPSTLDAIGQAATAGISLQGAPITGRYSTGV